MAQCCAKKVTSLRRGVCSSFYALGQWKLGFYKYIGVCSSLEAELWGVYVGLGCALGKGLQKIVIEMDCSEVMILLLKNSKRLVSMPIMFHIRDLVRQLEDVEFKLICRSNNKVPDRISRFACSSDFNVHVLECPINDLQDILLADVWLFGSG
ncbi:hypothetical protein V6N13_060347 [Hibiscus sabdariffa]